MNKPKITRECVVPLVETKFIKVYDLQYEEGKHYFDATRHVKEDLVATKSDEEFKTMLPDAVTCFVIIKSKLQAPRLLSFYEYRYPAGRFLLSPPAGLIDPEDKDTENALISTAKREIEEETGITIKDTDRIFMVNPFVFSTPGMTDESNGLVCAVVELEDESILNNDGAVGSECFDGFRLLTKEEAYKILKDGRDQNGNYYSLYMWAALTYFVTGLWEE